MKTKILLLFLSLLAFTSLYAQDPKDPFEKFMDMKGVTVVYVSESMLKMMPDMKMKGVDVGGIRGKLKSVTIITAEKKSIANDLKKEITLVIKSGKYTRTMIVKEDNSKTEFFISEADKDKNKNFIMTVESDGEMTIIRIQGDISLQDIQKMTK